MFSNLLGYGRRDSASSMFAINEIDTYEALMRKTYFTFPKGCFRPQITLLLVLIPTHGCDITTCGRSGIIPYIFVITIECFILY